MSVVVFLDDILTTQKRVGWHGRWLEPDPWTAVETALVRPGEQRSGEALPAGAGGASGGVTCPADGSGSRSGGKSVRLKRRRSSRL